MNAMNAMHITTRYSIRMQRTVLFASLVLLFLIASCSSGAPEDPKIEEFPARLLGTWEEVGGPIGTLTFTGTDFSGIGRLSADGIQAETFTFIWSSPAIIQTDLNEDQEFSVLFEDGGDILVLATVDSFNDEIVRYRRLR